MKRQWLASPYIVWMVIFIVVPMLLILFYSITEQTEDGIRLTLDHFRRFIDPIYINVLLRSLSGTGMYRYLLAYPWQPYWPAGVQQKEIMYMLIALPYVDELLLRTYAWLTLLERSVINSALSMLGLPSLDILYTNEAVVLGMVYNSAFMILPISGPVQNRSSATSSPGSGETILPCSGGLYFPEPARRYIRHNHGHAAVTTLLFRGCWAAVYPYRQPDRAAVSVLRRLGLWLCVVGYCVSSWQAWAS